MSSNTFSGKRFTLLVKQPTIHNAEFLRIHERVGTIEKGKLADLMLVEGDPLTNINVMRNVKRVMLNGVWVAGQNIE